MKKTYIHPAMKVYGAEMDCMLLMGSKVDIQDGEATEWGARDSDFDWEED